MANNRYVLVALWGTAEGRQVRCKDVENIGSVAQLRGYAGVLLDELWASDGGQDTGRAVVRWHQDGPPARAFHGAASAPKEFYGPAMCSDRSEPGLIMPRVSGAV